MSILALKRLPCSSTQSADCFAFFGRFLDSIDALKEDITSLEVILASWRKMQEDGHF
jgi:hypothetical protein